jgi:nucleoside-diphosphate-sugar epimerase
MIHVLITGVTGFVGHSLVVYLQSNSNIKLYGHSRNAVQAKELYKDLSIEIVSEYTVAALEKYQIHTIIHLAGIAHDLSNQYVEADYFRVNYEATQKLYDEFLKSSARKFIYFSSIKAAADVAIGVLDEHILPDPVTPYGKSKLKAEEYIQANSNQAKQYYLIRPSMIHGPRNKGNLNLLYKFVRTGIPYPLGAFENKRSFLGADNMSFMISQLIEQDIVSGIYNLSDSESLSTNEVVTTISEALAKKPRILKLPAGLLRIAFSAIGKKQMLQKLTDDMQVSNAKILKAINRSLPFTAKQGLIKTIQSFHA